MGGNIVSERPRYLEYGKTYGIPAGAIEALQCLNILPVRLPSVRNARVEDDAFLRRYALVFNSYQLIRSSLAKCSHEDRLLLLKPPPKGWEQYVLFEYRKSYRERTSRKGDEKQKGSKLPTKAIYQALEDQYGIQLTAEIKKKVDDLRRAAFRRVVRENIKF